ncbi:cytosolic arginine sensor for mTORC1 subunit 1-like [Watersipora subatra]|uniref:cytosolic arginine sensor for mTORC1 subunit 1-like n=1 Tax=Watersipora subatra TaxID=2589382 RepID=UPI00355B2A1A
MVNVGAKMDERMEINILDYRLKVMSIAKPAIERFTHALIDVLFFKSYLSGGCANNQHGFVSVTETDADYSVIVEEEAYKAFEGKSQDVKVNEQTWLPLVASTGPAMVVQNAAGISKIANSVVIPLADRGISVYPLSTYKTDYVLIQEADFDKVCEVLAQNFRITREGHLQSSEIVVEPTRVQKALPSGAGNSRALTHTFDCSDTNTYCMTSMDSKSLEPHGLAIIKALLYSGHQSEVQTSYFFNLSIIEQDISLILNVTLLNKFPAHLFFDNSEYWRLITIGDMPEGVGFRQAGIVAQISEPIASADISEYYISSFYYGHAFVPFDQFDEVRRLLIKKQNSQKAAAAAKLSNGL